MTAADHEAILRARAAQLALPLKSFDLAQRGELLLVFRRGAQQFALNTRFVREIVPLAAYTELPFAPALCLGVVSARGELFALFDVPLVEGALGTLGTPKLMLLCGEGQLELALATDEALELVEPQPLLVPEDTETKLCAGVDPRGFIVIDGAALLSDARLSLSPSPQEIAP
jgi:chemotaxis signal transduction protein